MFSSQLNQVFSCDAGISLSAPLRTAATALRAISSQLQNHCGTRSGSIMSPERLQGLDTASRLHPNGFTPRHEHGEPARHFKLPADGHDHGMVSLPAEQAQRGQLLDHRNTRSEARHALDTSESGTDRDQQGQRTQHARQERAQHRQRN